MPLPYAIDLKSIHEPNGHLTVLEEGTIPFPVRRAFFVTAGAGEIRGAHAHRLCQQLLVPITGETVVRVTDGKTKAVHKLTDSQIGLVIPALIWATQEYVGQESTLLVICDQLFDECDYIRDFDEFVRLTIELSV